jgi:iron complex outermembrane recepter protein
MKKLLLFIIIPLTLNISLAQNIKISGTVSDSETKEGIPGANIIVKGKLTGTVTDASGNFELTTAVKPPFIIVISVVGYDKQEMEVSSAASSLSVSLVPSREIMNEVVFSASRVEESILQSPVSIEKLDNK